MKDKVLQIRIDEDLLNKLKVLADKNGLSISSQLRMLIKRGVDNE